MDIPIWVNDYVGIEFVEHGRTMLGLDCWGLVCKVYQDQFGIELPSYSSNYETTKAGKTIQSIMDLESKKWTAINGDDIQLGDIAVFAMGGFNSHVGIIVSNDSILHIEKNTDSVVERFKAPKWGRRLRAFYRHDGMMK